MLVPDSLIISSTWKTLFSASNTSTIGFNAALLKQWQLPIATQNNQEDPKTVVSPTKLEIHFIGHVCSFPTNKIFLFNASKILIAAQGSLVSEKDFESQYYAISTQSSTGGITMSNYVNKAEKYIKAQVGTVLQGKKLFINVRGQGYRLNAEFLPAKILGA